MTDAPSPSAKAVDRAVELLTWISQWLKENPNRVRPDELRRIDFETLILLAPALTAERERVKALTRDCQTLEMAYADEGALRISHEGLIEKLKARTTTAEAQVKEMREGIKAFLPAAPMLVEALLKLANATDAVGVAHFDTDDMSDEVTEMQAATLEARRALAAAGVK